MVKDSKYSRLIKHSIKMGYRVLEDGQVIGLKRKPLNLYLNKTGYLSFSIRKEDKNNTNLNVHKLQAYQKYGDLSIQEGIVVRHLNGNKQDNSYDNIAIGTQLENIIDMTPLQRKLNASSPIHNHLKIIEDITSGMSYKQVQEKYNISSKGTISFIVNKSMTKHKLK